jgi:hypothetical protein
MIEPGQHLGLAREPLEAAAGVALEHLEGDQRTRLSIPGAVDGPHAALPGEAVDREA